MTVRSDGARQGRREDEPEVVEGGRERQDLEVRDRDDPFFGDDDDRVALGRVELDRELRLHVVENVAAGALDLGQVPERQRILEVAGRARLPDRAPAEQLSEPVERPPQPGIRPNLADRGVEHRRIGPEALKAQRAGHVHRIEERDRVRDGEGRPARRERVVVEQGRALAGLERNPVEQRRGEVGERRKIRLADRPDRPKARRLAAVEGGNHPVRELRPDAGRALGEMVGQAEHRRADDVLGGVRALADDVVAVHRTGVAVRVVRP